ncbi:MAG: hypothetical protein DRH37_11330 [Deltaproteobacteria bacterium]|nr:MAG: hypothetical protein DRH37_11330 [Deltaproteobacteria bacterium]
MINKKKMPSNIANDYSLSEFIYSCGYKLRLKHASFKQEALNWIANNCSELLRVENPKILSLGCGTGLFDTALIKIIQQQKTQWSFTGLDFSATDLEYFRKTLSALDEETQSRVSLQYKKFEPSTDMGEPYDLITMIHFLHSFDDVLPIIKNALRHLSSDGSLLIIQHNKQGVSEIKNEFMALLPNQKFQCSDHIKQLLQAENMTFSTHTINASFDISIMQEMSLDTLLLMSFCLVNDLSKLTTDQQERIRQAFLSHAEKIDGAYIIRESMEAIVCRV